MASLRNKAVVITGASSGFGRGAAVEFARRGANVVLAARRKNLLKDVARECERLGRKALVVETDVSAKDEVEALAEAAIDRFDRIDVWVNNAGVATYGRYDEVPMEEHEQVIETNLLGVMYGSHFAMGHFRQNGRGTLINVGSYLSKGSAPYHGSYVASKHGVRGLGMSLRQELEASGENNIHVCTIMPTSMDTPFFEHAANHSGKPVEPIKPFYDPEKVVQAIVRAAVSPEPEIMVGGSAKFASVIGKLAPSLIEKRMAKKVHQQHFGQRENARDKSGSVFEPMDSGDGVRGGWQEGRKPTSEGGSHGVLWTLLGAAAAAGMLRFAFARRREMQQRRAA